MDEIVSSILWEVLGQKETALLEYEGILKGVEAKYQNAKFVYETALKHRDIMAKEVEALKEVFDE